MSDEQAQPTGRLWGDMFGLGPIMRLINDPELGPKAHQAIAGIIASSAAMVRIEAKLDFLLRVSGHDPAAIVAALPGGLPDGNRGPAVAGAIAHDGGGGVAPVDASAGGDARPNGRPHPTGGTPSTGSGRAP